MEIYDRRKIISRYFDNFQGISFTEKDLHNLLERLRELNTNYYPKKFSEDFHFLLGYIAALEFPEQAERDVGQMIKKYLS